MKAQEAEKRKRDKWLREARRLLDERLVREGASPSTDADWAVVRASHEGDYGYLAREEEDLAEMAYGLVTFSRQVAKLGGPARFSAGSIADFYSSITPSAWFENGTKSVLRSYEQKRTWLRAALGLWGPPDSPREFESSTVAPSKRWVRAVNLAADEERESGASYFRPLSIADVGLFLAARTESEPQEGPLGALRYPTLGAAEPEPSDTFSFLGDSVVHVAEMQLHSPLGARFVESDSDATQAETPVLGFLRSMSLMLGHRLAVDSGRATAWLLCDYDLKRPWIDVRVAMAAGRGQGPAWPWERSDLKVVLEVGSLLVSPDAVASAYLGFRNFWFGGHGVAALPKPPDNWDERHREFMDEWSAAHDPIDWKGAWEAWQRRYPDSKWTKFRSFRNARYQGKGAKP